MLHGTVLTNYHILILCFNINVRSKPPSKGKGGNKSNKSSQKSKKTPNKTRVVWEDNTAENEQKVSNNHTSTNSTDVSQSKANDPASKCNLHLKHSDAGGTFCFALV